MLLKVKCNWKIKTLIKKSLYSLISGHKPQSCPWCWTGSRCSRLPAVCLPRCLLSLPGGTQSPREEQESVFGFLCGVATWPALGGTAPPSGEPWAAQRCLGLKGGRLAPPGRCSHLKAAGPGVAACWACGGWGQGEGGGGGWTGRQGWSSWRQAVNKHSNYRSDEPRGGMCGG